MLKISEIFYSLQGETTFTGLPTIFIRLTGCPLRCVYCDTAYAFSGGRNLSIEEVLQHISQYKTNYVTVTGGEPLAQKHSLSLLTQLCAANYSVSLETSGAIDVSQVDKRVHIIMDLKTPGSKEESKNNYDNIQYLQTKDQIKFVICDRDDFEWMKQTIAKYELDKHCQLLISPSYEQVAPRDLAEWILADNIPGRMQIQLHKYIWGDVPGK